MAMSISACQILESSSGRTPHIVRGRSASELRAERQNLPVWRVDATRLLNKRKQLELGPGEA